LGEVSLSLRVKGGRGFQQGLAVSGSMGRGREGNGKPGLNIRTLRSTDLASHDTAMVFSEDGKEGGKRT